MPLKHPLLSFEGGGRGAVSRGRPDLVGVASFSVLPSFKGRSEMIQDIEDLNPPAGTRLASS